MCVTFFFVNDDPSPGAFRLVLAMNRDEFFARKTDQAEWKDGVLAGRDMTAGKEGGTWLGMDGKGRVALLSNIMTGVEPKGKGRGSLVVDFLKGELDATAYMDQVSRVGAAFAFSPFNLCLFEKGESGKYVANYYCSGNAAVQQELPMCLRPGIVQGLSNHPWSKPFQKTERGKALFASVVERLLNDTGKKEELVQALLEVMSDGKRNHPDDQMKSQLDPETKLAEPFLESLTSVFVEGAGGEYGTRTQTVILVDFDGVATFVERTRESGGSWTDLNRFEFKTK